MIVASNLALIRFTRASAKLVAAVTALIAVGLYVPYSIIRWPGGDIFAMHLAIYLLAALACGMLLSSRATGEVTLGASGPQWFHLRRGDRRDICGGR